jgi:hypothetical protein
MTDASDARRIADADGQFLENLSIWIGGHRDLLNALVSLRDLGEEGKSAVDAICSMPLMLTFKLSFELWMTMRELEGDDPDEILLLGVPFPILAKLRRAVWGAAWPEQGEPWTLRVAK